MLELFYWPTPNGKKVTILLEELGVPYEIKATNIGRGDQFDAEFLKFSPNNRMPALADTETGVHVFESGAIMMYIAEKHGRFFPQDLARKYDVVQWVMWQMGNQGPKFGEQGHFFRAAQNAENGDLRYAVTRFSDEVHRLYGVMNLGLHKKDWLAAGEYTIADMICYPWAAGYKLRKIDLEEFPNVKRWMERMEARPAVKKAMEATLPPEAIEDPSKISDEEKARRAKLLVNQRATQIPASWG
ncbi:MAG: glutathione S-transferase N-terminal domain-containing protein [Proteobacteria bacterium]|nr:glutathione S-transferase N-terminal domain-containing protein [Pseudomonadota bacterium]